MLIDVELPTRLPTRARVKLAFTVLSFIVIAIATWWTISRLFVDSKDQRLYATLGVMILFFIIGIIYLIRTPIIQRRTVDRLILSDIPTDLAKLLSDTSAEKMYILHRYLPKLLDAGIRDCVIRLQPLIPDDDLRPFTMPFEPHPLGDLSLLEMQDPVETKPVEKSEPESELRQAITATAKWFSKSAIWILIASFLALYLVLWFYGGTAFALKALIPELVGAVVIVGLMTLSLILPSKQIFLVPAGLVIRSTSWLRKNSTLHLLERRNSVLAVFRTRPNIRILIVANRDRVEIIRISRRHAQQALRAWLSPLDPPSNEQLSDLS